jgi:lipoprotein-anchoring transpeptidase ErfK/SrfK
MTLKRTLGAVALLVVLAPTVALAQTPASVHVVKAGETMYAIARQHGLRLADLIAANSQVKNPSMIYPGMQLRLAIDWLAPSGGTYPSIKPGDKVWLEADISDQRVYVKKGTQTLYTMITSSGMEPGHATPLGTYYVEQERGDWFYSWKYQEGAKYWTSWKGHGEYLFHSVVMDRTQNVMESEARKLGTEASHGCFRMTLADAKWIYTNIPTGTKVVIHQ